MSAGKTAFKHASIILGIPCLAFLAIIPFGLFLGWTLVSMIVYWFGILPLISIFLPSKWVDFNYMRSSLIGLCLYYLFMIFMIYEHYQTSMFLIMMVSWVSNILLTLLSFKGWSVETAE